MLGWKFAFNNISLIFLDNNNKNTEKLFIPKKLQEYINFPDILLFCFLPLGYKIGELFDFSICLFISLFIQIISIGMIIIFFVTDYTLFTSFINKIFLFVSGFITFLS